MKQYWVNIKGNQAGPVTHDAMFNMSIDVNETYVWCEGMADWERITDCPDLADVVAHFSAEPAPEPAVAEAVAEAPAVAEPETEEAPAEEAPIAEPVAEAPKAEPVVETPAPQQRQVSPEPEEEMPPCPPSNLVWAVLSTILCLPVFGIIAIIYGAQVSSKYYRGDYEGAQKYSDRAAAWSIASIVCYFLFTPIYLLYLIISSAV